MHGMGVTQVLDNGGTYVVLRRTKASRPYRADGFEVTKADYHAWVDAMTTTCADLR